MSIPISCNNSLRDNILICKQRLLFPMLLTTATSIIAFRNFYVPSVKPINFFLIGITCLSFHYLYNNYFEIENK